MIQSDHARRTLLMHAQRLAQTAIDAALPHRAVDTLAQADALAQFLDTLAGQFARTPVPCHAPSCRNSPRRAAARKPSTRNDSSSPPPRRTQQL
ncbi:hypothetical protein NKH18_47920 [Streptomyces sp. M10(2022)]